MTAPGIVRQLHASLATHAPEQIVSILQEVGYAAGEGLYNSFAETNNPADLDAAILGEALSEFFQNGGGGGGTMTPAGASAFWINYPHWAEAGAGTPPTPLCFFSAGRVGGR